MLVERKAYKIEEVENERYKYKQNVIVDLGPWYSWMLESVQYGDALNVADSKESLIKRRKGNFVRIASYGDANGYEIYHTPIKGV